MRNIILFDTVGNHTDLLPITFTRPVSALRVGIVTIAEKWQRMLPGNHSVLTVEYLRENYPPAVLAEDEPVLFIASRLLPDAELVAAIEALAIGEVLRQGDSEDALLAANCRVGEFEALLAGEPGNLKTVEYGGNIKAINFLYDIFGFNGDEIVSDYKALTAGRIGLSPDDSCKIIGPAFLPDGTPSVFIEEGATVEGAILNTKSGPIYIGKDAQVMEGSCIRGPFALCDGAKVNMLSKIYPDTTIGPLCKVGGELNNVVMLGRSNKAHDGYLGNAVIGEWCNIGAGANASNLKNDYSKIRLWNYRRHTFMRTDLQFCGLIMGDHSKAGINCMFNTATVVGVGCNIHGAGFPRVFIPSFSEGSPASGFTDVPLKKFLEIASRVMARRGIELSEADRRVYEQVERVASQFK